MSPENITAAAEALTFGSLWSTPVVIDGWHYDQDDEDRGSYTVAFTLTDDRERDHTLIAVDGRVRYLDDGGRLYESNEWNDYAENNVVLFGDRETLAADALTGDEFEDLFEVDVPPKSPLINSWYPCYAAEHPQNAARLLGLPVCLVTVGTVHGFALTGVGQDFAWEIVAAFVAVGQLPPVHFARSLPGIAGCGTSERDRLLIAACQRSLTEGAAALTLAAGRLTEDAGRWQSRAG
jgi:hypothetical protein